MRCMGFLSDAVLRDEAARYGDAGGRPQVIWPNGVLASMAVGLLIQLLTPWHRGSGESVYLEYDGNALTIESSNRMIYAPVSCQHFNGVANLGDPWFRMGGE